MVGNRDEDQRLPCVAEAIVPVWAHPAQVATAINVARRDDQRDREGSAPRREQRARSSRERQTGNQMIINTARTLPGPRTARATCDP